MYNFNKLLKNIFIVWFLFKRLLEKKIFYNLVQKVTLKKNIR